VASVRLEKVWKKYGKVEAVKGISMDIKDGEFMAFVGPSGCGKSSTMRMIAGLEEVTGGTIFFDDKPMNNVRPRDRNVAMAFETYALYTTLNVYENLAFPLRAAHWPDAKLDKKVREIARIMGITELLNSKTDHLSSGQQQTVGLARALTREPSVFLLDEPISHSDTKQRSQMRTYFKHLHLEFGYTMIYVTHDQEEAMALADRVAVMNLGEINQMGTPEEIFNHPTDLFVAGFIGEPPMNFLSCEYTLENGQSLLKHGNIGIEVPAQYQPLVQKGEIPKLVILGIRPFYVGIGWEKSDDHAIPAEIFVLEPMGDTTVVSVDVFETRFQVITDPDFRAEEKQPIWLSFDPAHIVLFDAASKKAIAIAGQD
jgi:multiple sugar transport system ATP-binding protein